MTRPPIRVLILVGGHGRGSNMQAIIDACQSGQIHGRVAGVIGSVAGSPALDRAAAAGIPASVVPFTKDDFAGYQSAVDAAIRSFSPDLVCLAGYLKRLSPDIVRELDGRIMNIHPALIPAFCGQGMYGERVHQAVFESGAKFSGCTVHFVDEGYDTGPIIMQAVVPVEDDDTPATLAARVLEQEHRIYPASAALFAEGRLRIEARRVRTLPAPVG